MEPDQWVRAVGVGGVVVAYIVYAMLGTMNGAITAPVIDDVHPLVLVVLVILTLVSPEWIDRLPWGPSRKR